MMGQQLRKSAVFHAIVAAGDDGLSTSGLFLRLGFGRRALLRMLRALEVERRVSRMVEPRDEGRRRVVVWRAGPVEYVPCCRFIQLLVPRIARRSPSGHCHRTCSGLDEKLVVGAAVPSGRCVTFPEEPTLVWNPACDAFRCDERCLVVAERTEAVMRLGAEAFERAWPTLVGMSPPIEEGERRR